MHDLLTRFADVARPEIRKHHVAASCVAATWVTLETFRRLGYTGTVLEARASLGNAAYLSLWQRFGPPKPPHDLDVWANEYGAHVVGIGQEKMIGGIGGHLLAFFGGDTLVDASLDQAAAPAHGLSIPPVVVFRPDPRGLPLGIFRAHPSFQGMFLEYVHSPLSVDYRQLPDWGKTEDVRNAVDRLVTLLS